MATTSTTGGTPWDGSVTPMRQPLTDFEWAHDTGYRYLQRPRTGPGKGPWIPVLVETSANCDAQALAALLRGDAFVRTLAAPAIFLTPSSGLENNRTLVLFATPDFVSNYGQAFASLGHLIAHMQIGAPVAAPGDSRPGEFGGLGGTVVPEVVCGVVDDGFAFALDRFRRADGSPRVAYVWDQQGAGSVPDVGFGREVTSYDIRGALAAQRGATEESVYTSLRCLDYAQPGYKAEGRRFSHGTAAMDRAFGLPPSSVNAADDRPVVAVKLPDPVTENPGNVSLDPWAVWALYYILVRADRVAQAMGSAPLPVVVNMSYAVMHNPHDGRALLERAIDFFVATRPAPLQVVLPTGNAYLARCHAAFDLAATGGRQSVRLRVQPDCAVASWVYFYVRGPAGGGWNVRVKLTDPQGHDAGPVEPGEKAAYIAPSGCTPPALRFEVLHGTANGGSCEEIAVFIAPTTSFDPAVPVAASGAWTIAFENTGAAACRVDGWIRRNTAPPGRPRSGRQAYFDDPAYQRFDIAGRPVEVDNGSYVKRALSISGIATGGDAVAVAGVRRTQPRAPQTGIAPARYSGAGPLASGAAGPKLSAVCDDSPALPGVLVSGTRSGSVVAVNGTSMAAPWVARRAWESALQNQPFPGPVVKTPYADETRGGKGCVYEPMPKSPKGVER